MTDARRQQHEQRPDGEDRPTEDDPMPLPAMGGVDGGALGIAPPPESAPPGAEVDAAEHRVPGAHFERPIHESKPWFTNLAAESDQAGVANDEPSSPSAEEDAED